MTTLAHFLFGIVLGLGNLSAQAETRVHKSSDVDYSWVNDDLLSGGDDSALDLDFQIAIRPTSKHALNAKLISFIDGINSPENQAILKKIYRIDNKTYFTLARLAVGIMHAESRFGTHPKYVLKERFPWTVSISKNFLDRSMWDYRNYVETLDQVITGISMEYGAVVEQAYDSLAMAPRLFDLSTNSRGPTQIKFLPPGFEEMFPHINKNNLHVPQYAAVATMAYLAQAISTLAKVAQKYECEIPHDQFLHHLLYIYIGRANEISSCTATLDQNQYWLRNLEVQGDLNIQSLSGRRLRMSPALMVTIEKMVALQAEITQRKTLYEIAARALASAIIRRSQTVRFEQDDINTVLEYMLAAGFVTGTHIALKHTLPSREAWVSKSTCRRLLLGRKRHFALLYGFDAMLLGYLHGDPKFDLNSYIEVDADRKALDNFKAALALEGAAIRRLELEFIILRDSAAM